jgi:uncharacterized protein YndB with AHSA1/START domain
MSKAEFVYVTYIRTTPEKLWDVLLDPDFQKQYWSGYHIETDWKKGSFWKLVSEDGSLADAGEVEELEPPKRLVLSWRHEKFPEFRAEGATRCTFTIEPIGDQVKLSIVHADEKGGPNKLIGAVSNGWPMILSSLKSLIETGKSLPRVEKKA